jgi:UDP-glucose:(heptosyl)LPS alpha-1,3-glucosyltransferase
VQEVSNADGVETVAVELARVFGRNGLSNVVLASTVAENLEQSIRAPPSASLAGRRLHCR